MGAKNSQVIGNSPTTKILTTLTPQATSNPITIPNKTSKKRMSRCSKSSKKHSGIALKTVCSPKTNSIKRSPS